MAAIESVWWDLDDEPGGNVQHISEHGVTKEAVEEVLNDPGNSTDVRHSSGRPATFG